MKDLKYTIRDYTHKDFDQLELLWKMTGLSYPERGDNKEVISRCLKIGGKLLIMRDIRRNILIGSCWMTDDGRRIHLHHFAIHPDYQNRGLGKVLATESLRFIKTTGRQVKLEVQKDNLIAKHLYEKFGFFAFSDYDIYILRDIDKLDL